MKRHSSYLLKRSVLKAGAQALAVIGTVFFMGSTAQADDASALAFVQKEAAAMEASLRANQGDNAQNALIDSFVDYDEFARRSLGQPCPPAVPGCTNWNAKLTPEQQANMRRLLRLVLQKSYKRTIKKTLDYNLTYKSVKASPLGDNRVRSLAQSKVNPRDPEIQVDYNVRATGDPKVVDMVAEGASVTKNYYDSLNKKLSNEGYDAAVTMLTNKINKKE
ncbi:MAG: MlaC/ttg2D family ABC transporter substrate-binding protein [Polyangiaceae bacterium]